MVDKNGYERETPKTATTLAKIIEETHDDTDADKAQYFQKQCPNLNFLLRVIQEVVADYESATFEEGVDAFYLRNVNFLDHFLPRYDSCTNRENWCDETITFVLKIQNTIRFLAVAVETSAHFEEKNQDAFFWKTLLV